MYIDEFIPFLKKAPLLRRESKTVNTNEIFFPYDVEGYFKDYEESIMLSRDINIYFVEPLNIYVMDDSIGKIAWYINQVDSVTANVNYVDYQKVARYIEVEDYDEGQYRAFYPESNGFDSADIETFEYINMARDRISIYDKEESELNESVVAFNNNTFKKKIILSELNVNDFLSKQRKKREDAGGSSPPQSATKVSGVANKVQMILGPYLRGDFTTERVPLLAGPTAVMKSATVKELCNKYGYRMVDFRAAFIDRLDLEGLTERTEHNGKVESFNANMYELIECTDEFLDFCESVIPEIQSEIEQVRAEDGSEEEIAELESLLEHYQEKSKPAVLFFDEVTRASGPILNALTTILNEKEFNGHEMTRSKIVTATNLPTGIDEALQEIYGEQDPDDVAISERFQTIPIEPEDVMDKWWDWATTEGDRYEDISNIHPVLIKFLEENPDEKYNFHNLEQKYEDTGRPDIVFTSAFPNFRTWDLLTQYIVKRGEMGEPNVVSYDTVAGLLGDDIVDKLTTFMEKEGFEVRKSEPETKMDDAVEDAMLGNVPTMMITPSSMGKSARVRNVADKFGIKAENIIKINLAQQDSVDILGPPTKVDLASYVGGLGGLEGSSELFGKSSRIGRKMKSLMKNSALPSKVTIKAPKTDLAEKVRRAMANNERMIIFFDEFNRVLDKSVMTAIFEAVSDHRLFGVNFDPDLVTIFCAANIGENYSGAKEFDPAFSARFNVFRKDEYDVSDARSFKKYIKKAGFNQYVIDYLENASDEEVLEMIKQVDYRTLEEAVPSQRAFKDLSTFLNDTSDEGRLLRGTILFAGDKAKGLYDTVATSNFYDEMASNAQSFKDLTEIVKSKLVNWAALESDIVMKIDEDEFRPEEALSIVNDLYQTIFIDNPNTNYKDKSVELDILRTILIQLYDVDNNIATRRKEAFESIIGSQSESFVGYFNTVSGTEMSNVEIPDLKDTSLIDVFFSQKLSGMTDEEDKINAIVNYYSEFYQEFGESLSANHYQMFIRESISQFQNADSIINLLVKISAGETTDKLIKIAENENDISFIKYILGRAGFSPSDEELESLKTKTEYEGPQPKMLK